MTKSKSEFIRVRCDDGYFYEKRLPCGGSIRRNGGKSAVDFTAYDAFGNYLGFTADQAAAEAMAASGRVNVIQGDPANDLSLWTLWNEAVHTDNRTVFTDNEGNQFVFLNYGVFMRVSEDATGWDVELLSDVEMDERYWDEASNSYELHIVKDGKYQPEPPPTPKVLGKKKRKR